MTSQLLLFLRLKTGRPQSWEGSKLKQENQRNDKMKGVFLAD